jgi:hypothetical protein
MSRRGIEVSSAMVIKKVIRDRWDGTAMGGLKQIARRCPRPARVMARPIHRRLGTRVFCAAGTASRGAAFAAVASSELLVLLKLPS